MNNQCIEYVDGKAVCKVWTLEMIRAEIKRLDRITGLHGADVPCVLNPNMNCLGRFWLPKQGLREKDMKFEFSQTHFADMSGNGIETSKLDTVRHEYAHYYALVALGYRGGHGTPWKRACGIVNCHPTSYNDRDAMRQIEQRNAPYRSSFSIGDPIEHPSYGSGCIERITAYQHTAVLSVRFEDGCMRQIDEVWLLKARKKTIV